MEKVVITLDSKEVEEMKMILNDEDKDDALEFLREVVSRKVNDVQRERKCGPKL